MAQGLLRCGQRRGQSVRRAYPHRRCYLPPATAPPPHLPHRGRRRPPSRPFPSRALAHPLNDHNEKTWDENQVGNGSRAISYLVLIPLFRVSRSTRSSERKGGQRSATVDC